jgi:hypothetical protein
MKNFKSFLFLICFVSSASFSQSQYFISSSEGNDSNNGTSESSPIQSINKLNTIKLQPGDQIFFKRGDIWREQLKIVRSGSINNRITFGAYGAGNKPIITTRTALEGWKNQSNWVRANEADHHPNVWKMELESNRSINRMFLDNEDARWASDYRLKDYIPYKEIEGVKLPNLLYKGDNGDGTVGVCAEHPFYYDLGKKTLYIYATKNPADYYSSIELPGIIADGKELFATVEIRSKYIKLENLDLQGGMYASVALSGADYAIINNCNIGKYTNWTGLNGDSKLEDDKRSDHVTVSNCVVDSDWRFDYIFYNGITPYGIRISSGSYWNVYDCYVKDWWMSFLILGKFSESVYNEIHNNEITSNCAYGKALQIVSGAKFRKYYGTHDKTYLRFYNNYVHDIVFGIQITSQYNYFYFNIFENMRIESVNEHGGGGGWASQAIQDPTNSIKPDYVGDPRHNYFFNNTFIDLRDHAHLWDGNSKVYYMNNMYINCGIDRNGAAVKITNTTVTGYYYNNLFFSEGYTKSNNFVRLTDDKLGIDEPHNIEWLNKINSLYSNKHASGNTIHNSDRAKLINSDFSLPNESPALSAGTDISSYIPTGFTDRFGNAVNKNKPSIGAFGGSDFTENSDASIQITTPNGGEILNANNEFQVSWKSTGIIQNVHIFYSNDNGVSWKQIASHTNQGIYNWTVPDENSDLCLLRIKDADNFSVVDISDNNFSISNTNDDPSDDSSDDSSIITAGLRVFLEAPFSAGIVNSLNSQLPKEHPFNQSPWNVDDNSSVTKIESNYLDWLLVELVDDQNNKVVSKPAILTSSGKVINTDGTDITLSNIPEGEYYLVVDHRNHLAVMSSNRISIKNNEPIIYDFTDSQTKAYGEEPMTMLSNGRYALYAGDSDGNGAINNLDIGMVANRIPYKGYSSGDLDMNGVINVLDYSIIAKNLFKKSFVPK